MPAFIPKTTDILQKQLQIILSQRYSCHVDERTIKESIERLNSLALLNSDHVYLKQTLTKLCATFKSDSSLRKLDKLLIRLFNEALYNVNDQSVILEKKSSKHLAMNALILEQEIRKAKQIAETTLFNDDILITLAHQNKPISNKYLLTEADIRTALLQLAKDKPSKSKQLIECQIISIAKLKDNDKINALSKAIEKTRHYPAHIIINTGGHWTRLRLEEKKSASSHCIIATYINSNADSNHGMVDSYTPLITKSLKKACVVMRKEPGSVTCIPTAHQTDDWSCGYHVLAGIASDATIKHGLQTDQQHEYTNRTNALRNWVIKQVIGKTFDEHNLFTRSLISTHKDNQPPTHSLKQQVKPEDHLIEAAISSHETPKKAIFPEERRLWLQKNLTQKLGYHSEFKEMTQRLVLTPIVQDEKNQALEVIVSHNEVTAVNSTSLSDKDRDALAETMIKLFITNEFKLSNEKKFPSINEIKDKKLIIYSLTGNCEALKQLIKLKASRYNITVTNALSHEKITASANTADTPHNLPSKDPELTRTLTLA